MSQESQPQSEKGGLMRTRAAMTSCAQQQAQALGHLLSKDRNTNKCREKNENTP